MGNPVGTTYSFADLTGVMISPLLDAPLPLVGGNIGLGDITITPLTERADMVTGNDGVVMPSYIPGDSADVSINVQQTSALHHAFLSLFNQAITAANGGDISNWASMSMSFRTTLDGSQHTLSGVMFSKTPPKVYGSKGQNIAWLFKSCYSVNQ
jgi:Protein of unknown function (DUF3277)